MKLYVGVNQDGTCIISKQKIKRFLDYETNNHDIMSYSDSIQPPHWMLDYTGIPIGKSGDFPVDKFLTLSKGALKKMFDIEMTWEDDFKEIEI